MNRAHVLAASLLDGLIREDVTALDATASAIRDEDETERVLCCIASLLVSALVNVHGEPGALARIDQFMAEVSEWSA